VRLVRGMKVRLTSIQPMVDMAKKFSPASSPSYFVLDLNAGDIGIMTTDADESGIAKCRFEKCSLYVDLGMVEILNEAP
jgi:hypothetical protein